VPCDMKHWTVPPFDGEIKDGKLYGRGTQDMKICLAAYIEAMRILGPDHVPPRSIHLLFLPDEEIGGEDGMGLFVKTQTFRDLNIGFALDEGLASATSTVPVYFGERAIWWIKVKSTGDTGHASRFLDKNSAVERLHESCGRALKFREAEADKFRAGEELHNVVTLNMTSLKGLSWG
jgi:aminoacylase